RHETLELGRCACSRGRRPRLRFRTLITYGAAASDRGYRGKAKRTDSFAGRGREILQIVNHGQFRSGRVVYRQLPGRPNRARRGLFTNFSKWTKHLVCDRATPQYLNYPICNLNNGRFDSVLRCTAINNQRDTAAQLIEHVLRRCWADPPEPICAWRGQRPTQFADYVA